MEWGLGRLQRRHQHRTPGSWPLGRHARRIRDYKRTRCRNLLEQTSSMKRCLRLYQHGCRHAVVGTHAAGKRHGQRKQNGHHGERALIHALIQALHAAGKLARTPARRLLGVIQGATGQHHSCWQTTGLHHSPRDWQSASWGLLWHVGGSQSDPSRIPALP